MSRFHAALSFVLSELDRRRESGAGEWRASAASLDRLQAARLGGAALREENAPGSVAVDELEGSDPTAMPKFPDPDVPGLFDERADATSLSAAKPTPPPRPLVADATRDFERVTDRASSKAARLEQLRTCSRRIPCAECPYGQAPHNHVVFGIGNADAELMFVGEAPGAEEDAKGEPFVGKAGQLLTRIINTMGYQREDVYIANVLKCRPDTPGQAFGNRPPRPDEMASCRPTLYEQIEIIAPKAVVALGATAMKGLLDDDAPMRDLRGRWHTFNGVPVMATYHPSYLLRNQQPSEKRKVWEDMLLVKERLGHEITDRDRAYFLAKG